MAWTTMVGKMETMFSLPLYTLYLYTLYLHYYTLYLQYRFLRLHFPDPEVTKAFADLNSKQLEG
jgi:hypothetical protein